MKYIFWGRKARSSVRVGQGSQQMKQIEESIDEVIVLRERTQGDKSKYDEEVRKMSQQLVALRQQRDMQKKKCRNYQRFNLKSTV